MTKNAIVLGAGIVGVSTAIHLQRRGRQVTLIDRKAPGKETSFGNAGLIQREGVVPYGFPQQLGLLIRYAFNNRIDAHYHLKALPGQLAFLARYWWNSGAKRHAEEAEGCGIKDRGGECERCLNDQRSQAVRQDRLEHQTEGAGARDARRYDIFLFAFADDGGARQSHEMRLVDDRDGDHVTRDFR